MDLQNCWPTNKKYGTTKTAEIAGNELLVLNYTTYYRVKYIVKSTMWRYSKNLGVYPYQ
jgi:hypothetical protein